LRAIITRLRRQGLPICSQSRTAGGGYYLAAAGSELEDYCKRLRKKALKGLCIEALLRQTTLPELLGRYPGWLAAAVMVGCAWLARHAR
jgi:hypothetical protein